MRQYLRLIRELICIGVIAAAVAPLTAAAQNSVRTTILEENDSLYFNSDKHYTQGFRVSALLPDSPMPGGVWDGIYNFVGIGPTFVPGGTRRTSFFIGQSIFTPKEIAVRPPDPRDRPYAGWLYGGASLMQENQGRDLENLELDFGVVGPGSFGKQVQNDFHQLIGAQEARGWSSQIQQEFGGLLSYDRLWRLAVLGNNNFGVDVVPQAGLTVGNIMTYAQIGGMLRIGSGLHAEYGPVRIRPGLSGTDYYDPAGLNDGSGYYFFIGTQGRAVAQNIFLDGNSFRFGRSVPKKTLVGDIEAGFTFMASQNWRFDFSVVRRTEEFYGQRTPDVLGTAALSFNW